MAKKSSRREQPAPEEDNANFEGDLQPLLDDLAALREALGNSFKEPSTDEFGDWDEGLAGPHHPLDETPGVEVSLEERIRLVTEALEANQALQARLKRLIASVERAQDKAVGIKDSVQDRLNRRLVASQAPRTQPVRRESAQYTGRSWFWSVPDAPPPPAYPDSSDVLPVTASLPLVLRRASWSEDERNLLRDGVLQTVQEHLFNRFLSEFEAGSAAGAGATLADFQAKQAPIRDLNVYSPVVEETGAAFSDEQWATVAHRHVHGRTPLECKLQWRNAARPSLGKDEFTPEEASQLQELVEEHGDRAWATIAEQLEGHAPLACLAKYQQLRQAQREPGEFTDHDLQRLIPLVQKHGTSWRRLAENFGGKWTPDQLCHFWRRHEQRTEGGTVAPRKGRWEPEEDDALYKVRSNAVVFSGLNILLERNHSYGSALEGIL